MKNVSRVITFAFTLLIVFIFTSTAFAQTSTVTRVRTTDTRTTGNRSLELHESSRSDKFTGGRIERGRLEPGNGNLKITVDVPAFQLTLWQDAGEIKTYPIGVGKKDFPIIIGEMKATQLIWNPSWIVPDSEWVVGRKGVKPGDVVPPTSALNPLGKMKIPLGYGYLIHEAASVNDLGNLVSHGCVRMLRRDLYDLAEKIAVAREADVTPAAIAKAKRTKQTLVAELDSPLAVDINYDTMVVEAGKLRIYADFYGRGTNKYQTLQRELAAHGIDENAIDEQAFGRILKRLTQTRGFVVPVESVAAGRTLSDGRAFNVIPTNAPPRPRPRRRA